MAARLWRSLAALPILTSTACGSGSPPPPPAPNTTTFTLSCASPIGPVNSPATYTLTATAEPVKSGAAVTYTITAPGPAPAPLTPTFISSTSSFAVPAGLSIDSVQVQAPSTADYSAVAAALDGGLIGLTVQGSFPMNSTPRPVPPLVVAAHVTAAGGAAISWMPPVSVVGNANAGVFGTQTSSCTIKDPAPIGTTNVD